MLIEVSMSIHGSQYFELLLRITRKLEERLEARNPNPDAKLLSGRYLKIYGLL